MTSWCLLMALLRTQVSFSQLHFLLVSLGDGFLSLVRLLSSITRNFGRYVDDCRFKMKLSALRTLSIFVWKENVLKLREMDLPKALSANLKHVTPLTTKPFSFLLIPTPSKLSYTIFNVPSGWIVGRIKKWRNGVIGDEGLLLHCYLPSPRGIIIRYIEWLCYIKYIVCAFK